ncbi:hypothetical protein WJX75_007394 [Coccomyxa subellipsoidea]|uniref:Uncharacterized protein n=1 Tax=Coccomyxa subellipsoidea TaxID=248742 RepID=A0ABR2YFH3_9CHLO
MSQSLFLALPSTFGGCARRLLSLDHHACHHMAQTFRGAVLLFIRKLPTVFQWKIMMSRKSGPFVSIRPKMPANSSEGRMPAIEVLLKARVTRVHQRGAPRLPTTAVGTSPRPYPRDLTGRDDSRRPQESSSDRSWRIANNPFRGRAVLVGVDL